MVSLDDKYLLGDAAMSKSGKSGKISRSIVFLVTFTLGLIYFISNNYQVTFPITLFEIFTTELEPTSVEIFEIQPDFIVPGVNVTTTLYNSTITGKSKKIKLPEFNSTGAILQLNISSDAESINELSINSIPIWRFSTPDKLVNASTYKNITEYLSIIKNGSLSFTTLEGKSNANVTLSLIRYDDGVAVANGLFESNGPADIVLPLDSTLPPLPKNITSAKLSIFASPSDLEILYYKNDLPLNPLRYINVFINDIYINSISPKPTLFHSDKISTNASDLWVPLSDVGSLSGLSYEVDLISVLPFLYTGAKIMIQVVAPEVTPGLPTLPHPVVPVADSKDWKISGSISGWASSDVVDVVYDIIGSNSSQSDSAVLIAPPATSPFQPSIKNQIIKTKIDSGLITQLNYTLPTGTSNFSIEFNASTHAFITKQSKQIKKIAGPPGSGLGSTTTSTSLVVVTGSKINLDITDISTGLSYLTKKITADFPFTFSETTTDSTTVFKGPTSSNSVKAEINADIKTTVNKVKNSLKVKEKLSLDDIKGASTDIKFEIKGDSPFKREVEADNGVIVKDILTLGGI